MRLIDQELLEEVIAVAEQAGEAILEVYQRVAGIEVEVKADNSPVTEADLAAEAIVQPALKTIFPGVPVLSEESEIPPYEQRRLWERYWLVDPLDGTREFIARNDEFTVNIALVQSGVPILGVVHVPVTGVTYAAVSDRGAFKYRAGVKQPIHVRSVAKRVRSGEPLIVAVSRRHGTEENNSILKRIEDSLGKAATCSMGSSLKLCLVAEGEADIYPKLAPTSEWDTAAGQAIVEAAGGQVVDERMKALRYNTKSSLLNPPFYVFGDASVDWAAVLS